LIMSIRLNEEELLKKTYEAIPPSEIQLIVQELPPLYIPRVLSFLGRFMETSRHIEFDLMWCLHIFNNHGSYLKSQKYSTTHHSLQISATSQSQFSLNQNNKLSSIFRQLQKTLLKNQSDLTKICDDNYYTLHYLSSCLPQQPPLPSHLQSQSESQQEPDSSNS